jgi:hypothetical protein
MKYFKRERAEPYVETESSDSMARVKVPNNNLFGISDVNRVFLPVL